MPMPAVSLAAVPGKRARALEMAVEIERRGFTGIYCPSLGDALGLCTSLAHVTSTIRFGTSIEPIYLRHPSSMASTASYIHEVSEGRFDLGLGVSHGPVHERLQLDVGRPLSDMREYVGAMRSAGERIGELPPIVLATLRDGWSPSRPKWAMVRSGRTPRAATCRRVSETSPTSASRAGSSSAT